MDKIKLKELLISYNLYDGEMKSTLSLFSTADDVYDLLYEKQESYGSFQRYHLMEIIKYLGETDHKLVELIKDIHMNFPTYSTYSLHVTYKNFAKEMVVQMNALALRMSDMRIKKK